MHTCSHSCTCRHAGLHLRGSTLRHLQQQASPWPPQMMLGGRCMQSVAAARPKTHLGLTAPRLKAPELLAVLLQVAGHILPCHAVHVHELQDRFGHSVLDPLHSHSHLLAAESYLL